MEKFSQLVTWVDGKVWGWGMILLLLGTHLFMTVRTGFIQRKTITKGIKLSVSKEPDADGESVSSEHLLLRWHLRSEPEILSVWELPLP